MSRIYKFHCKLYFSLKGNKNTFLSPTLGLYHSLWSQKMYLKYTFSPFLFFLYSQKGLSFYFSSIFDNLNETGNFSLQPPHQVAFLFSPFSRNATLWICWKTYINVKTSVYWNYKLGFFLKGRLQQNTE